MPSLIVEKVQLQKHIVFFAEITFLLLALRLELLIPLQYRFPQFLSTQLPNLPIPEFRSE